MEKIEKNFDFNQWRSTNSIEKNLVLAEKVGGGPKKVGLNNLGFETFQSDEKLGPVPAKKLDHAGPTNGRPAPGKVLPATTSQMTSGLELSPKREMEEDWEKKREEKRGKEGKKRGRSEENVEEERPRERKKLKKGKLFEDLRRLHIARTGVRVRLESDNSHEPSIASFCHKIDRMKKLVNSDTHNDFNGEGKKN